MKYFIEILLEKKLIGNEKLLEAIFARLSKTPPASEVAFRHHLLSNEQLIEISLFQSRENKDFKSSCHAMGLWTKELEERLLVEMENMTPSLAQILVEKGFITHSVLTQTLDQYLNNEKIEETAPVLNRVATPLIQVAPVSDPLLGELLTDDWIEEVHKTVQKISLVANDVELKAIFNSLQKDFHKMRGIGRYTKANQIERLAESMETLLIDAVKSKIEGEKLRSIAESLEKDLIFVSEFNRKVA